MRVEDVGISQAQVVFVVEDDAEVMQVGGEPLLGFSVGFALVSAKSTVALEADEVFWHGSDLVFDAEPTGGEGIAEVFKAIGFAFNGLAEGVNAFTGFAVCFEEFYDVEEFLPKCPTVEVEGMGFDFVEDDEDGGFVAEAFDKVEPIFGIGVFVALATVEYQNVEAALGQEKLMGSVHDFLSAKVPNIEAHVF